MVDIVKRPQEWAEEMFSEDASFVVGHFPVARGFSQIAAGAQGIYDLVTSLKHTTNKLHSVSDTV